MLSLPESISIWTVSLTMSQQLPVILWYKSLRLNVNIYPAMKDYSSYIRHQDFDLLLRFKNLILTEPF